MAIFLDAKQPTDPDETPTVADWGEGFVIDDGIGDGSIRLAQIGRVAFRLESSIRYNGNTGLGGMGLPEESIEVLRQVTPADVPETDLASIPAPMRWWINSYGAHTPAAIIHDRFIGSTLPAGVSEWQIDRYFRFMLADTGVRVIKRWIMWAAVALRTRWATKGAIRTALLVWFLVAISGTVMSIVALTQRDGAKLALYAVLLPLPAAGLWGRQAGAGLIAAYLIFPFLIVPMLASLVMLLPFWLGEIALSKFLEPAKAGTEPLWETVAPTTPAEDAQTA